MLSEILYFLVILNPFAQFIYLFPVMRELHKRDFMIVLLKASAISFVIFSVFLVGGDFIFKGIFMISFGSFRIFGGIVMFAFSYYYIVEGKEALIRMKESLDDLASEIALPFMVGAGTISVSVLLSDALSLPQGLGVIGIVLGLNFFIVMLLGGLRGRLNYKKQRVAFDKFMQMFMRVNGFFVGAIGINLIVTGIIEIVSSL